MYFLFLFPGEEYKIFFLRKLQVKELHTYFSDTLVTKTWKKKITQS